MRRAVVAGEYKNEGKGMEVEVEKEAKRMKEGKKKRNGASSFSLRCFVALFHALSDHRHQSHR